MQGFLVENAKIVPGILPRDITGAAQDGDWVNLKNHRKICIVLQQGAWAGGTPAVTLEQATDNAGTSAKALSFSRRFSFTAITGDTPSESTVTSDTFNLPATANTTTIIEIHAQDMDLANGFTHLRVKVASPGANADLLCAMYILYHPDNAAKPSTQPSVIA